MKTALVWFTTDLRLHDNETLTRAVAANDLVIPVYVLDDRLFGRTSFGTKKTGPFRFRFLMDALRDLHQSLVQAGSGLLLLQGRPETELPRLAAQYKAHAVYAKKQVADEELKLQEEVRIALYKQACSLELFSTSTLYLATDLPFSLRDIPDLFTSFRKKVEKECSVRPALKSPSEINSPVLPAPVYPGPGDFGLEAVQADPRSAFPFQGGERAALQRLNDYVVESGLLSQYKITRNQMLGTDYSSKFSPWLAMGCLSPKTIWHAVRHYEAQHGENDSTYWLRMELMWRDFFRFMMKKHHIAYFLRGGIQGNDSHVAGFDETLFEKWKTGHTGLPLVDACMQELRLTGFMSNRGRQNVASYLVNDLKVDWRYGAAHFEEMLVDYDVCSNWGNWAYIAGVGNDARRDRYFNIDKQQKTYDPDGSFVRTWLDC